MPVFVNKYENYREKKGTVNKMESEDDKANQSHAEKADIKAAILKYGMIPPEMIEPEEKLYLTNIDENLTLNERMQRAEYMTDYFYHMPAKVRKEYHDNAQEFIIDILVNKNIEKARKHGIISQEIYDNYTEQWNLKKANEEQYRRENEYLKNQNIELTNKINEMKGTSQNANENNI